MKNKNEILLIAATADHALLIDLRSQKAFKVPKPFPGTNAVAVSNVRPDVHGNVGFMVRNTIDKKEITEVIVHFKNESCFLGDSLDIVFFKCKHFSLFIRIWPIALSVINAGPAGQFEFPIVSAPHFTAITSARRSRTHPGPCSCHYNGCGLMIFSYTFHTPTTAPNRFNKPMKINN